MRVWLALVTLFFPPAIERRERKNEDETATATTTTKKLTNFWTNLFSILECVCCVCVLAICAPLPYHQHHCIRTHWLRPLRMGKSSGDFCCFVYFGSFLFYSSPSYLTKTRTNGYGNGAVDSCVELSPPMSDKLNGETIQYQYNEKNRILPSIDRSNNRRHFLCGWQFVPTQERERDRRMKPRKNSWNQIALSSCTQLMQSLCQYSCYAFVSNKHHVERHWWWILTFISYTRAHTNRFECRLCWWRWRRRRLRRQWWRWRRHQYTKNDEKQKKNRNLMQMAGRWLLCADWSELLQRIGFVRSSFPTFRATCFSLRMQNASNSHRELLWWRKRRRRRKRRIKNKKSFSFLLSAWGFQSHFRLQLCLYRCAFISNEQSTVYSSHDFSLWIVNARDERRTTTTMQNAQFWPPETISVPFFSLSHSFRFFCGLCIYIGYKYYDYIPLRSKIHTYSFSFGIRASVCVSVLPCCRSHCCVSLV